MFCTRCGTQVAGNVQFCPNCGQPFAFAPGAPLGVPPTPPPSWTPPAHVQVAAGRWIGEGWGLVKADLGGYLLITLIYFLMASIPLIQGSLVIGFSVFTIKKLTGRRAELSDLFKGFNFFLHALVASLLIGFFAFLGTLACLIPGLVIAAMFQFTYLFIVDKKMEFWPAMQASHALVKTDYVGFTIFIVLAFLVNLLGVICLVVGLFVTVPLTMAATVIAYKELVGFDPRTADL